MNQLITEYTGLLRRGEVQIAYKGILNYLGELRSDFARRFAEYEVGSNIYQGYMDMSYFSVTPAPLKPKGLKIAVVYLHEKGTFEAWLSARNRETLKKYREMFGGAAENSFPIFHDATNEDAIMECTLTAQPNFDDSISLTELIENGTEKFISAFISKL